MTTSVRATVSPRLLVWARERSRQGIDELATRFPKLTEWESGKRTPTLKQLEDFAQATHTPIGFLFLPEPPEEQVPIPDYRTMGDAGVSRPSPDLLDTIFHCQQRQEWYRDFAQVTREDPVAFVGSLTTSVPIAEAAEQIRTTLRFNPSERGHTWSDALRTLVDHAEELGVLVMVSGVVGANTHRKLDPEEFRGFSLVDQLAPLVFVNGADTKAAQIFTLTHELVHLFLGETALDDSDLVATPTNPVERWCNQVATEVLVPLATLRDALPPDAPAADELESLARRFKVSTLVVLRRVHDAGRLSWDEYRTAYRDELARVLEILAERSGTGGNFFNTQPARVSKRFARAVIVSTLEGQTLHRDAFQMLGLKKLSTFEELASRLGAG
ncbi:MAG TPA: ImmA/IrrE family metallo-endopeptidase [Actinomycetota bacterium]|nr:ImmA/IrrE family metallo-endopeptidase [Actinomycetota bacterium]